MPKLSARTEITSGLTFDDLMHLVNGGASWKLKLSTLQKFIAAPVFPGCVPLFGMSYVSLRSSNLPVGDSDLYTVPAGKRLLVLGHNGFNQNATTIIYKIRASIASVYYLLFRASVSNSVAFSNNYFPNYIAEAGEKISINTDGAGLNLWLRGILFDDTSSVKSPKITSFIAGNNTLYTCPAGKTAAILSLYGTPGGDIGELRYSNDSGGTRTVRWYVVPSGQAVGVNYAIMPSANYGAPGTQTQECNACLSAGDSIIISSDANTAGQFAWAVIAEF